MKIIGTKEMRILEINSHIYGVSTLRLMENAGAAVANIALMKCGDKAKEAIVYAGKGGNGGDGFVAARIMAERGLKVKVVLTCKPKDIEHQDAIVNFNTLRHMDLTVKILVWDEPSKYEVLNADIIVDALLGTGVKGVLKEPIRTAVETINKSDGLKVAVDIPTGVDPNTGNVPDIAVKADITVTMHAMKPGILKAKEYCGEVHVANIGIPPEAEIYVGPGDVIVNVPHKPKTAHKGVGGRVLVVGGSELYTGAPALAALSALRSGSDLVVVVAPEKTAYTIASYSPNIITKKLSGEHLRVEHVDEILEFSKRFNSIIIGPGLGLLEETMEAVINLLNGLRELDVKMVIDADGLKALAKKPVRLGWKAILTPHAIEASMLIGCKPPEPLDLEYRSKVAIDISKFYEVITVLKGPIDVIAFKDKVRYNKTGNEGMSVGGTGDVLSGIIGSLLGRGVDPFDAGCIGAYVCGLAGDLAYLRFGERLTATDVMKRIPGVFKDPLKAHIKVRDKMFTQ